MVRLMLRVGGWDKSGPACTACSRCVVTAVTPDFRCAGGGATVAGVGGASCGQTRSLGPGWGVAVAFIVFSILMPILQLSQHVR